MSVEDKIKELLEASMQEASAPGKGGGKADAMPKIDADADGKVDDAGAAVVSPDDKNGPAEVTKKVKKASAPGGEKPQEKMQKVKEDEDADEDVIAEEEVAEGEMPPALKKAMDAKKKKGEKEMDEEDDDDDASDDEEDKDDDDDDMEEMKKMKEKLHAEIDKMKEMKHMKASYGYMKSSYKMKEDVDMSDDVNALTEGGEFDE